MALPSPAILSAPTRFVLALGFAVALVVASVITPPGTFLAETGPLGLFGVDKWIHFGSYGALALLLAFAMLASDTWALLTLAFVVTGFGAGVEVIQFPHPTRSLEFADVVANALGAFVGVASWVLVLWVRDVRVTARTPTSTSVRRDSRSSEGDGMD